MKVLIVNNAAPFVWGGAEELAENLKKNLIVSGHRAEVWRWPFRWDPAEAIPAQMLMVRAFELINVDRVIALKFPAYLVRHPEKTLWLLHQYRQAYDLFGTGNTNVPDSPLGQSVRSMIERADNESFAEARHIYANSTVTRDRLKKFNGFDATVLLPPVNDAELFTGQGDGDYIFAGGRINAMKRQHLLIEAMQHAPASTRLVVAGPPDSEQDGDLLRRLVEELDLGDRVHLDLGFLPRQTYADYLNGARAVAYLPVDEDSLGYVAMEAALAGKPLISATDSGGILGLAVNGTTGWVTEPTAVALGGALAGAWASRTTSAQRGAQARERWTDMGIGWPQTVEALLR